MDYKGYRCKLCGVYKVEQGKKLYALEIFEDNTCVFKSDWIYEGEKMAFKDAKKWIRKGRTTKQGGEMDTTFVHSKAEQLNETERVDEEEMLKEAERVKKIAHKAIMATLVLTFFCHIVGCFGFIFDEATLGVMAYFPIVLHVIGLIMEGAQLFMGVFFREYHGNERYYRNSVGEESRILRELNRVWNLRFEEERREARYYNRPYDDSKKEGWHSSIAIIFIPLHLLFGGFVAVGCIANKYFGLTFYVLVITFVLWLVNYILCVMWEISDAKVEGKEFPYRRVMVPFFSIMAILAAVAYYYCINVVI